MKQLSLKDWVIATRPWSFPVSFFPAFVALLYELYANPACASHWQLGVLAIFGAVIFQAAGNLISDCNDFKNGIDRHGNVVGTDTLTSGLFRAKQILAFGWTFIAIGVAIGLFLVWQTGLTLLWIGMFGTIAAVFYYYFKVHALGDFLIYLIYGPTIMLGTGFVVLGYIDWTLLLLSIPIAAITVNVLHANNTRDIRNDREANIRTLAMTIGVPASKALYYTLNGLAYLSIIVMVVMQILPIWALITLITLPIAIKNGKAMSQITETDKSSINELDKATAQLQLPFSLLLAIALVIAIIFR